MILYKSSIFEDAGTVWINDPQLPMKVKVSNGGQWEDKTAHNFTTMVSFNPSITHICQ